MFIVSLALTPVELTAVCVYSEEGIDEYGQINFRLKRGAHLLSTFSGKIDVFTSGALSYSKLSHST